MTNYNWNYPTTVWVGKNRVKDLEKACVEIKTLKPLLVTDKDLSLIHISEPTRPY